jgi:hypothetical protein
MKIHTVYLFTNRNSAFYDEQGEQIADLQQTIGWKPLPSYDSNLVEDTLRQMTRDKPTIFIARWLEWAHEITLDEFASLIGFGPWYWDEKLKVNGGSSEA